MNTSTWMGCAAIIGLGVLIALSIHLGTQNSGVSTASAPVVAEGSETLPVAARLPIPADIAPSSPSEPARPPALDKPVRYDPQRMAEFNVEATRAAHAFQPGMAIDDSLPLFVTLFEESVHTSDITGSSGITELFQNHQQLPIDGWSAAMEYRLGQYFDAQPEIAMTRASVSCRSSWCLLQFMELPPPVAERPASSWRNSTAMLLRLKQEPWFAEEFDGSGRQLSTPARADAVQYMVQVLLKRQPTDR